MPSKPVSPLVVLPSQFQSTGFSEAWTQVLVTVTFPLSFGPAGVCRSVTGRIRTEIDPSALGLRGLVHIGHCVARIVEDLYAAAEDAEGLVRVAHDRWIVWFAVDAVAVAFAAAVVEAERVPSSCMNVPVCSFWLPVPPVQPQSVTMNPSLFAGVSIFVAYVGRASIPRGNTA